MPVRQQEDSCPSPDVPGMAAELLQRHSINQLFGSPSSLGQGSNEAEFLTGLMSLHDTNKAYFIQGARNGTTIDDYPNSPEGGQTSPSLLPRYFAPRNANPFASMNEISNNGLDNVAQHRSSPESDLRSNSSPTSNNDHISDLLGPINGYNGDDFPREPRIHRSSFSSDDSKCNWAGVLPPRSHLARGYSSKVFLGGLPWDISEATLIQTFRSYGPIRIEWPGKENSVAQPKGFVYMVFESERQVRSLLSASSYDSLGNWYYRISSRKMRSKEIQIIPWALEDSNYVKSSSVKLDPARTVFVGALHGMLSAEGLALIMNDLFNGVVYAGIDTDKHKYPIGSGRVTFNNSQSYMRAVSAEFVEIKTEKFTKKIQVDPYLEDSMCSICYVQQGPYFCKDPLCFQYYCRSCWQRKHYRKSHKPLMRNSRSSVFSQCGYNNHNGHIIHNSHMIHNGQNDQNCTNGYNGIQSHNDNGQNYYDNCDRYHNWENDNHSGQYINNDRYKLNVLKNHNNGFHHHGNNSYNTLQNQMILNGQNGRSSPHGISDQFYHSGCNQSIPIELTCSSPRSSFRSRNILITSPRFKKPVFGQTSNVCQNTNKY